MQAEADKGKLTAWERWELASFDDGDRAREKGEQGPQLPTAEEIEAIRLAAHEQGFEQGRQHGHEQGQQQGYAEGHAEGHASGRAQAQTEGQQLAALGSQLDEAMAKLDQQMAEELLGLSLELARQVLRQALVVKPELLLGVLREALAQMPQVHATIHLHPEDASLTRSYLGEQLAHAGHRIVEDAQLQRGDCIIDSGSTRLDATVAVRWKRVAESLGLNSEWLVSDKAP